MLRINKNDVYGALIVGGICVGVCIWSKKQHEKFKAAEAERLAKIETERLAFEAYRNTLLCNRDLIMEIHQASLANPLLSIEDRSYAKGLLDDALLAINSSSDASRLDAAISKLDRLIFELCGCNDKDSISATITYYRDLDNKRREEQIHKENIERERRAERMEIDRERRMLEAECRKYEAMAKSMEASAKASATNVNVQLDNSSSNNTTQSNEEVKDNE